MSTTNMNQQNWFILAGDQKYGPYDYKTMIQMYQKNQLLDHNYIWAPHIGSWTPVHQLEEFSQDRIKLLMKDNPEFSEVFVSRKNKRSQVSSPLLGHNYLRFFDGEIVSVSKEGGLCLLNSPILQVGDRLKLHIKADKNFSRSFNVECEIIRKNFSQQRINSKSGLYYAVRFHDIQKSGVEEIQNWISKQIA